MNELEANILHDEQVKPVCLNNFSAKKTKI